MDELIELLKSVSPALAITLSVLSLIVARGNYRRKSGVEIRGSFSIASDIECDDLYVSYVTLENQKDRAISVFGIYLQVGYGIYICLETFEGTPQVLKAFEPYHHEFGPTEFYSANLGRVDLNDLLRNPKVRKRLVLSTGEGRYVVLSHIRHWDPIVLSFRNHFSGVIHPVWTMYDGRYIGSNIRFVIDFVQDGKKETVLIRPEDYRLKKFRNFQLTKASLESRESLSKFFEEKKAEGTLKYDSMKFLDLDGRRAELSTTYAGRGWAPGNHSAFQFYVLGKLGTIHADWQMRRQNKRRTAQRQALVGDPELRALSRYHLSLEHEKATKSQDLKRLAAVQVEIDHREGRGLARLGTSRALVGASGTGSSAPDGGQPRSTTAGRTGAGRRLRGRARQRSPGPAVVAPHQTPALEPPSHPQPAGAPGIGLVGRT